MNCLICGSPVLITDYCSNCGLKQEYLIKAHNTSNYYYNLGLDRAKVRDLTGAIDALYLALKYNKRNTSARNLMGLIQYEIGEPVEALSHWVISTHYDQDKNRAAFYLKDIQSSAAKLEAIDQLTKKFNQALTYASANNKDLALIQMKRVLGANPHFLKGFLLLALLYMDMGNYDKAKKAIKRVLRIDKNNTLAIKFLYEMEVLPEEIIEIREKAANIIISENEEEYNDDDEKKDASNIGDLADFVEDSLKEINSGETTLQIGKYKEINFSKHTLVYVIVGIFLGVMSTWFLFMPGKIDRVKAEYKESEMKYNDEIAKNNLTITNLEASIEDLTQEKTDLTEELDKSPEDQLASDAYEKLITATNYYSADQKQDAAVALIGVTEDAFASQTTKDMFNTIVTNCFAEAAESLYESGKTLYDAGDYVQALDAFEKSVALDENSEDGLYYLAMTYELNNMHDEASAYFTKLNEKYPESDYHNSITQYLQ